MTTNLADARRQARMSRLEAIAILAADLCRELTSGRFADVALPGEVDTLADALVALAEGRPLPVDDARAMLERAVGGAP